MAVTTRGVVNALSTLGGRVCVDGRGEELIVSAIADGVSKAGEGVQIIDTTGATLGEILAFDVNGSTDRFVGILLPKYDTDCDTVITDRTLCEVVIPKSGHKYNVFITDPTADIERGAAVDMSAAGDGAFHVCKSTIEVSDYYARTSKSVANTSTFCEIIWN